MKNSMFRRVSLIAVAALTISVLVVPMSLAHADGFSIPAQINKSFNPVVIASGQTSRLTIVVYNPNAFQLINTTWTDNLIGMQPGLYIANPPNVTVDDNNPTDTNCGSPSITAAAGSTSISFSGGTVPAIAGTTYGECTVSLDVSSVTGGGNLINDIPIGALTATDQDDNTVTVSNTTLAEATLEVNPVAAPSLTKSFAPNTMNVGSTAVLTVNITNNDPTTTLTNTSLTDDLTYLTAAGLVLGTPVNAAAPVNCGSGGVTGNPGDTKFSLSNASIDPGLTCTLKINITSEVQGAYINTIPAGPGGPGSIQTQQGVTNATAATANLNVQAFTMTKAFAPASIPAGSTSTLTLTIKNNANIDYHNVGLFDDLYPYSGNNLQFVTGTDTYTNCGSMSATVTDDTTDNPGSTVNDRATFSGGTIVSGATCTIKISVQAFQSTPVATYLNRILAGQITTQEGATNDQQYSANLGVTGLSIAKTFGAASIPLGSTTTLTITITNPSPLPYTNADLLDDLSGATTGTTNSYLSIAAVPNASTTCETIPTPANLVLGARSIELQNGTIPASGNCTITVTVVGSTVGNNRTNTIPIGALKTNDATGLLPGGTNAVAATKNISITAVNPTIAKTFTPNTLSAGDPTGSQLNITITNPAGGTALTNMQLIDTLPAGLQFTGTPTTTCTSGTETVVISTTTNPNDTVTLSGGALGAGLSTCKITAIVIAPLTTNSGTYNNNIGVGALKTGTPLGTGASNTAGTGNVPLTVRSVDVLSKTFTPATFQAGGTSSLVITLANYTASPLTVATLTDNLAPANLSVAAYPPATAPSTTCGGTFTYAAAAGATVITVNNSGGGITIPLGTYGTPGTCTVTFPVTGTVVGTFTNTIPAGNLITTLGSKSVTPRTATVTIYATGAGVTLTKAFGTNPVNAGSNSVMTLRITAPADTSLSGVEVIDNFPQSSINPSYYMQIGNPTGYNTNGNCGTFTNLPSYKDTGIDLKGGTIAAGVTCQITVNVFGPIGGSYANDIVAGNVKDNENRSTTSDVKQTLTVNTVSTLTVAKNFQPSIIATNAISTLTIYLDNSNTSVLNITSVTDNLPGSATDGILYVSSPPPTSTCGTGWSFATSTNKKIVMTGGSIAGKSGSDGLCSITVTVQGKYTSASLPATYNNTINTTDVIAKNVDTGETMNSTAAASASLELESLSLQLVKKIFPTSVNGGSASALSVQLTNTGSTALTGISFTDTMYDSVNNDSMFIAQPPDFDVGSCHGAITGTVGTNQYTFSGGSLAANSTCTLQLMVTQNFNGTLTNTIPAGAVTTDQGATNPQKATASLTNLPGASLTKFFTPNSIPAGSSSTLTITVKSTGGVSLTGMGLKEDLSTDTNPSGLKISSAATSNTCNGTLTATPGTTLIQLANGSLAANSTCSITVGVTGDTAGSYLNCIPASRLTDTNSPQVTNQLPACDTLTVTNSSALGDYVWDDVNANGIQDAGETGIAGVTVTLYGSNGTTVLGTTTTNGSGNYSFTNLAAGTYYVGFTAPSGYTFSPQYQGGDTAQDSNASPTTNITTGTNMSDAVTLTAGETDNTIDAGMYQPVTIGDFVWNDTNGNGIQDSGEAGINGVTLTLTGTNNAGMAVTDHTTTSGNGSYLFTEAPGTYTVTVDASNFTTGGALVGYTATPTLQGPDRTIDSNVNPSGTTPTALSAGGSDLTVDFGYNQGVTIGDFVWNDTNGNGLQDSGEAGINGVTLTLTGTNGAGAVVTDTATTDANGKYLFTEAPGTYTVTVDASNFTGTGVLAGFTASPTLQGSNTALDSNPNPSGTTPTALSAGGSDLTVDFGYYKPVTIGDFVWNDVNTNGLQDSGEAGINGVTLTLTGTNGAGAVVTDTATTDANGKYLFTEAPGTYTVTVDASNFTGAGALVGFNVSPTLQGADRTVDSNVNPSGTTPAALDSGGSDLTVDFGYYNPASLAALGDYVWNDANVNGIQDSSEKGIPNVTVKLYDSTGKSVLATTTTDANGYYHFTNLVPDTYYVGFTAPGGYKFSPQYAAGSTTSNDSNANTTTGMSDAITLIAGQTDNTIDAGLWQPAPNLFDPPYGVKVLSVTNLPELEWQMTWINNADAAAINVQVSDPIPAGTTYDASNPVTCNANGASTTTSCIYDPIKNQIFWQGTIASDLGVTDPKNAVNKVVITYTVTVTDGVNSVNNQGTSLTDTNGDGSFADETTPASVSASNIASWSRNAGRRGGGGSGNGINPAVSLPSTGFAPGVITSIAPEPANVYDTSSDLTIEIPALGIKTAIVGVPQSGNTWDITWLGDQVGYLDGTAFPTWSGNSVLTGHVYMSNGLPGPFVNLHTLKWGDQIIIHFAGQRYVYEVRENNIVSPTDRSAFKHEDQPWLTLVTCKDYNASANTYAHRVVVGAVLVKVEPDTGSNSGRK